MSEKSLRYIFADFIMRNRTNKNHIRVVAELAGLIDEVSDLADYYDNGTLFKECENIIKEENNVRKSDS
jgi:hypothetical protein